MRVICLSINSVDNLSGVPKWEYSLAFAYIQAYYTKSSFYEKTEFINLVYYENEPIENILNGIQDAKPNILCFSCYIWNIDKVFEVVDVIKESFVGTKIVLGGPEFSEQSEEVIEKHPNIDIIVIGEGERILKDVLDCYNAKEEGGLQAIKGIVYRATEGKGVFTGKRNNIQDLNDIPSPYLLGIVDLSMLENRLVAIETQRGCFCDCAYCNYQKGNKKLRFFDCDRVFSEIELILRHKPKQLYLMDPTFNSNRKRTKEILECIKKYNQGTVLNAEMIPDTMDEDIIKLSKAAGMKTVEIGIQSLNMEAIRIMGRYRNSEKLFNNVNIAIKEGLYLIPQIIFGLPGDNFKTFLDTFEVIYDMPTEELDILILLLLPQTRYRNDAHKYGIKFKNSTPYQIVESESFTKEEIALLLLFKKLVLVTQPMKLIIREIKQTLNFSYYKLFLNYLNVFEEEWKDFDWPIHTKNDKDNAIQTIENFYIYCLNEISGLRNENLRKKLFRNKRNAQFMLATRFMRLPN
jgi:radical SAM superfamily enzyme YgiQ (UPF0313 family)